MKAIEISYSRTAYFHKIIEVEDDVAEEALKCDGEDLNANTSHRMDVGFNLIAENFEATPKQLLTALDKTK